MFILINIGINIYFVGHVYTLFGVGEEAYLRQVVKGVVSLFRGVLLLGGYVYLFLIHCPGGTSIKEGMFIWHYRVSSWPQLTQTEWTSKIVFIWYSGAIDVIPISRCKSSKSVLENGSWVIDLRRLTQTLFGREV